MNFEKEFPEFFRKTVIIKLDRIKLPSENEKEKRNERVFCSTSRVTRSQNSKEQTFEWVRVLKGEYKGDLGKVLALKNNTVDLKIFPRIDYCFITTNILSKRRPTLKPFDANFMRFVSF